MNIKWFLNNCRLFRKGIKCMRLDSHRQKAMRKARVRPTESWWPKMFNKTCPRRPATRISSHCHFFYNSPSVFTILFSHKTWAHHDRQLIWQIRREDKSSGQVSGDDRWWGESGSVSEVHATDRDGRDTTHRDPGAVHARNQRGLHSEHLSRYYKYYTRACQESPITFSY